MFIYTSQYETTLYPIALLQAAAEVAPVAKVHLTICPEDDHLGVPTAARIVITDDQFNEPSERRQ